MGAALFAPSERRLKNVVAPWKQLCDTPLCSSGRPGDRGGLHARVPFAAVAATAWPEREPLAAVRAFARRQGCGACSRAGRAIGDVLALASLSTSLGATAGMGSGAHSICAGHGSYARLLAALTGLIQHRLKRPHRHPK